MAVPPSSSKKIEDYYLEEAIKIDPSVSDLPERKDEELTQLIQLNGTHEAIKMAARQILSNRTVYRIRTKYGSERVNFNPEKIQE